MNDIEKLTEDMAAGAPSSFTSLPDIDLYMDQVLSYLSRQQVSFRDDEVLTSAMINNYIKAGLLPRASGKKYSREHLAYLTMICRLKQVISVKDTGILLSKETAGRDTGEYFDGFLKMLGGALADFAKRTADLNDENLSQVAMKLAIESYVSKMACEFIIDRISGKNCNNQ